MTRIAIFHPTDPLGHVPGGIDSFIKGILKWAPDDLEYTLFGASSDRAARPVGTPVSVKAGNGRELRSIPIVSVHPSSNRGRVPLSVRYMMALKRYIREGQLEGFDILDFHRIEPALLFGRDLRPKNVTLHADYSILRDKNSDIMWKHWPWLYERLEARAFGILDRVFAVRRSAVERYAKLYPEWAQKFAFIPTWMDADTFRPAGDAEERRRLRARLTESAGAPETARLLVTVGRLDYQKDPLLLLDAFRKALRRHPDLHLLMVGDGILRAEVESVSRSEDLRGRVSLLGVRRAAEIADILKASDMFVLSSAYEGMSIAVLEALAAGVPVVSTQVGEIDLVVENDVNGRISRDRSPEALADAMCAALDRLEAMRGTPCRDAVLPYRPERVLAHIYDNHRLQSAAAARPSTAA